MEVTGIECRGCGGGGRRDRWGVVVWEKRKSPEFDARGLLPPLEKDGIVGLVEDGDRVVSKRMRQLWLQHLQMPMWLCLKV